MIRHSGESGDPDPLENGDSTMTTSHLMDAPAATRDGNQPASSNSQGELAAAAAPASDSSDVADVGLRQTAATLKAIRTAAVVTPTPTTCPGRPIRKRRFLLGLLLAAGGMGLMLFVAAGALHAAGASGSLSLPTVALAMIIGLMLLGGGFGIMATSAAVLDDGEFERLMNASDNQAENC